MNKEYNGGINIKFDERIIGDFIEINADIYREKNESKYPKFIRVIIAKRRKRRLYKLNNKIRNSNMILNKSNITELFYYIFNNFPPKGQYKDISQVTIVDNNIIATVLLSVSDKWYKYIFNINTEDDFFDLTITKYDREKEDTFYIQLKKLSNDTKETKEIIYNLNNCLINIICDYLNDVLEKY